jgi:hypothetical protein
LDRLAQIHKFFEVMSLQDYSKLLKKKLSQIYLGIFAAYAEMKLCAFAEYLE